MKITCAIAVIAAAVLSLQQFAAAKSSSSNSQSFLDPLTIQEDTAKDAAKAKHSKPPKHSHNVLQKNQRSQLSGAYELPSAGALTTYQKVPRLRDKTVPKHPEKRQKKSSLSWNGAPSQNSLQGVGHLHGAKQHNKKSHSSLSNKRTASIGGDKKNIFESSADTAGKVFTAPVRGLKSLFKPKQPQQGQ
jgi:hypothetical protein